MKVVGLLSGGKDSCYNLCHCAKLGHEIVALATLAPPEGTDELDSYMYQTVGHDAVHLVAQAMELPLYRHVITGKPLQTDSSFGILHSSSSSSDSVVQDETEDLHLLLAQVKRHHPEVQGVSVGAILSNYQRFRVETICSRLDLQLQPLAYLWQRDQSELLEEMVNAGVEAVLIKCAGIGLDQSCLGRSLAMMRPKLERLRALYGAHVCGEGGEYETLTLDCPLFRKRIHLEETEVVTDSSQSFASVSYLRIHKASLVDKDGASATVDDVKVPSTLDKLGLRTEKVARDALEKGICPRRQSIGATQVWPSVNQHIDYARKPTCCKKGNWIAFSGVTATLPSSSQEAEVYDAFRTLRKVLVAYKLDLPHVQHLNLSLNDQQNFAETNKVYQRHFHIEPPSRATIALPHLRSQESDHYTVELDGWAYDDGSIYECEPIEPDSSSLFSAAAPILHQLKAGSRSHRQALHVQSLSYWASANIGPYSQGLINASRMTIAGQIGLLPVDLSLPPEYEGDQRQFALSIQHARRIFCAMLEERNRGGKGWIEGGICWIAQSTNQPRDEGTHRLRAALRCWGAQESQSYLPPPIEQANSQAVKEEEDDEERENQNWLFGNDGIVNRSNLRGAHSLPMLYAHLGSRDLPRGAVVEWQLTAHDGRRQGRATMSTCESIENEDDAVYQDNEEADRPITRQDMFKIPASSLLHSSSSTESIIEISHQSISSPSGRSSFGIVALRFSPTSSKIGEEYRASTSDTKSIPYLEKEGGRKPLLEVKNRLRHALSVKILVSLSSEEENDCKGEEEMDKRIKTAEGVFHAFLTEEDERGDSERYPEQTSLHSGSPAYGIASAFRLSTFKPSLAPTCGQSPMPAGSGVGGEGVEEEWEDWQIAFVWHDVE